MPNLSPEEYPQLASLEECREKIDEVDDRILELLNERTKLALAAHALKQEMKWPFDTRREHKIIERLTNKNQGPLEYGDLTGIYFAIFQSTRHAQKLSREAGQDAPTNPIT